MIERVQERGGTQLKFGGDALLSLFTGRDHAIQAASAAVEMRQELRNAVRGTTAIGRLPLRMSAGVESGAIHLFLAGDAHHELVVAGPVASATTELERATEAARSWSAQPPAPHCRGTRPSAPVDRATCSGGAPRPSSRPSRESTRPWMARTSNAMYLLLCASC
jgi:hypothetical protein